MSNIRRLANVVLERLEEGSREKTLDQGQTRLLSSTALKALRVWQQVLAADMAPEKDALERVRLAEQRLADSLVEPAQGTVKMKE